MIATVGIGLAGVLVLVVAAGLGYRKSCQRRAARALVIDSPNGIAEGGLRHDRRHRPVDPDQGR